MAGIRYRCAACGNLTRFDVVTDRRTRAFHHYTVGGELQLEDEEVLSEQVVEVACRWCGHGRAIEVLGQDAAAPESALGSPGAGPGSPESAPGGPGAGPSQPPATLGTRTHEGPGSG